MPEKACCIYREAGLLSLYASGPDREPELMVLAPDGWRVEDGELVFEWHGREVRLNAREVDLAARCNTFGFSVWWEPPKAEKPRKARRKS